MSETWGFALVLFEAQHVAFPMTYSKVIIPTCALTQFNREVQLGCRQKNIEHTHDASVQHAIESLINGLLPAMTDRFSDGATVAQSVAFISRLTNYQFWTVQCHSSGTSDIKRLSGQTLLQAETSAKCMVQAYQQRLGREMTIYVLNEHIVDDESDNSSTKQELA